VRKSDGRKFEDQYDYPDKGGELQYVKKRWRLPSGEKTFSYHHPGPDGRLLPGLGGRKLALYNLLAIAAAAPGSVVYIVEGEKDVNRLKTEGLLATCNPEGAAKPRKNGTKAKCKWLDRYSDDLVGFHCLVIQDNDQAGREHAQGEARSLHGKAASVKNLDLVKLMPDLPEKGDVSDFMDRGGTLNQLNELARQTVEWTPPGNGAPAAASPKSGEQFGNFTARIVREIIRHEGSETTRHVVVEATHQDGTVATATVTTKDFDSLGWVSSQLGLKFAIRAGQGTKDQFQYWIKVSSYPGVEVREIFTSLGWHAVGGKDVYLDVGGGIGESGKLGVDVDVKSELALYRLPTPDLSRLKEGTERVLAILDNLGSEAERVASIIMSLPYRALLGPSRNVPHFFGTTGTYKTSVACLAARFFAPGLEYDATMPLSWESTAASFAWTRHAAKDSLLIVDNFIADGDRAEREWSKINSVFNSRGDLVGKGRANPDGSMIVRVDPRGSLISTGECEPRRKSALGRSIIEEFKPGSINFPGLTRCHDDARGGWYAVTIACYARYLAVPGRLEAQRAELRRLAEEQQYAAMAKHPGCHKRHAEAVAQWAAAWELFLRFAVESKALAKQVAKSYLGRVREGLFKALPIQAEIQEQADSADIFLELLRSLLATKKVVLVGMDGNPPPDEIAEACGWTRRERFDRGPQGYRGELVSCWEQAPGATRIGWVDDSMVYLDPNESHAAVERRARDLGRSVGNQRQVTARLAETKRIEFDTQPGRQRYTKRVRVAGHRVWALWVPRNEVLSMEV